MEGMKSIVEDVGLALRRYPGEPGYPPAECAPYDPGEAYPELAGVKAGEAPTPVFPMVKNEFVGSAMTEQYLQSLIANGVLLLEANEIDYSDLIPSIKAERMILDLFIAGSNLFSQVLAYLYKNVKKYDPLDLDDSHEWINALYDNWPMTNGSIKKNAGEVSITILANILSLFYPKLKTITVFAQDRDTFAAHNKAVGIIQSCYGHIPMQNTPVSFKSNDFLFKQLYSAGLIDKSTIGSIRDSERTVMYSITQSDGSIVSLNRKLASSKVRNFISHCPSCSLP